MISGISIGVDLVSIKRVEGILEQERSKKRSQFLNTLTIGVSGLEEDYSPRNLAKVWAIKEALIKAWPYPFETWKDVRLYFEPFKEPVLVLGPRFQKRIPGVTAQVSVSFEGDMVVAVVLLCQAGSMAEELKGDIEHSRKEILEVVEGSVVLGRRPRPGSIKVSAPGLPRDTYLWTDDGKGNLYGIFELKEVVDYDVGAITLEPNPAEIKFDRVVVEYLPVREGSGDV